VTSLPELYPTTFPIKVMGRNEGALLRETRPIIERHAGPLHDEQIRERLSGDGNFVSLTFTIEARSREQLDALYRELTACAAVLMAL